MSKTRFVLAPGGGPPEPGSFMWQWYRFCAALASGDWPVIYSVLAAETEENRTYCDTFRMCLTQLKNDAKGYANLHGYQAHKPPKPPQASRMDCDLANLTDAEWNTLNMLWQQRYGVESGRLVLQQINGALVWHKGTEPLPKVPVGRLDGVGAIWVRYGEDRHAWTKTRLLGPDDEGVQRFAIYATGKSLGSNPLPWAVAAPDLAQGWDEALDDYENKSASGVEGEAPTSSPPEAGTSTPGGESPQIVPDEPAPDAGSGAGEGDCPVCAESVGAVSWVVVDGARVHAACAGEATGELFPGASEPEEVTGDPA